MMLIFRYAMFLFLFIPAYAPAADLDEILAGNTAALGGAENWVKLRNIRVELHISEPGMEVTGTYVATRDGSMRIDIEAGGRLVFSEGLHEGKAWQWTPDGGVTPSSDAGAKALRNGIDAPGRFYTLEQLRERGTVIELVESDGAAEWQLRLTGHDGTSLDYYVDKSSMLNTRARSHRAFHPDQDSTEVIVEDRYSDPEWVDGVLRFTRIENRNAKSGEWLGTTVVRSVEHNVDIPEGYFDHPG